MNVKELTREQLIELKQNYLIKRSDETGEGVSYGELADADNIVSDETIFDEHADTDFTEDDFLSSKDSVYLVDRTYFDINDGKEYGDMAWSFQDMWNAEFESLMDAIEGTKRQIAFEAEELEPDVNKIDIFTVCLYQKEDGDIIKDDREDVLRIAVCSEQRANELGIKADMFINE